jgi:hypothetical protein
MVAAVPRRFLPTQHSWSLLRGLCGAWLTAFCVPSECSMPTSLTINADHSFSLAFNCLFADFVRQQKSEESADVCLQILFVSQESEESIIGRVCSFDTRPQFEGLAGSHPPPFRPSIRARLNFCLEQFV